MIRVRFSIEDRHLTDEAGRPLSEGDVSFHVFEAETADEAVHLLARRDDAEIIGSVLKFPGMQAVATVRRATGVYTLQVSPTSQAITLN